MSQSNEEYIGPIAQRERDLAEIASNLGAMTFAELSEEAFMSAAEGDYQGNEGQVAQTHYARATAMAALATLRSLQKPGPYVIEGKL